MLYLFSAAQPNLQGLHPNFLLEAGSRADLHRS